MSFPVTESCNTQLSMCSPAQEDQKVDKKNPFQVPSALNPIDTVHPPYGGVIVLQIFD